jgi:hypothetical protein
MRQYNIGSLLKYPEPKRGRIFMHNVTRTTIIALFCLCSAGSALAAILPPTHERCAVNGFIDQATGTERREWALRCLVEKGGAPPYITGDRWFRIGIYYDATEGYASLSAADQQNVFPVYYSDTFDSDWPAPNNRTTACSALLDTYSMFGLCWSGCYTPDMSLEFSSGSVPILEAQQKGYFDLVTLTPESTLDKMTYMTNEVSSYTADSKDQQQTIYKITTKSGGFLSVTHEHPLLDSNGMMRDAQSLEVGDSLVRKDGSSDRIIKIEKAQYVGKVYNLDPTTLDYASNIVVAQGFLSGSRRYQGPYRDMINSVILRRALSDQFVSQN